jgi:hypothetical protein
MKFLITMTNLSAYRRLAWPVDIAISLNQRIADKVMHFLHIFTSAGM